MKLEEKVSQTGVSRQNLKNKPSLTEVTVTQNEQLSLNIFLHQLCRHTSWLRDNSGV